MVDVNPKLTGGLDALTLVGGMALKPIAEKLTAPMVGNGTFMSGIIKIGIAVAANKMLPGKMGDIATVAFGADGAEDIILGAAGWKSTGSQSSEVDF